MIEIYIPPIEFRENLDLGVNQIITENPKIFREIYLNFSENIVITNFGEEVKNEIIKNPLDIDLSDKKMTNALYKEILRHIKLNDEDTLLKIINELNELIRNVEQDLVNSDIEVGEKIDDEKLLQALNVAYRNDDNYLQAFISYIKTKCFNNNINVYVTFNLSNVIDDNEIKQLNLEMQKLGIYIVDFISIIAKNNATKLITIDSDLCII